jgi:hypothetical protein
MPDLTAPPPPLPPAARFADPDNEDFGLKFDLISEVLPSGRTAKVRPYKGPAERALLASIKADGPSQVDHLVRFLLGIVSTLDGNTPTEADMLDLHDADVRALLIRGRHVTHDDSTIVEFKWDCAPPTVPMGVGCKFRDNANIVDIAQLDYLMMTELKPVPLSHAKKTAAWFPLTQRRRKAYLARFQSKRADESGIDLDALFFSRGLQLDGKPATQSMVDDLDGKDRSLLRREMLRWGGVDSRVHAECNKCSYLMRTVAEQLAGFFFPEMEAE